MGGGVHVRAKHSLESTNEITVESPPSLILRSQDLHPLTALHSTLSPEITAVREEMALVVVMSILSGYVTDAGLDGACRTAHPAER